MRQPIAKLTLAQITASHFVTYRDKSLIDTFECLINLVQMPFDRQRHGAYADGP